MAKRKIPFGVNVLAVFMGLEGAGALIALIAVYLGGFSVSELLESSGWAEIIKPWHIYLVGVLAAVYFVGAIFAVKGHPYGWWALMVWTVMESTKKIYDFFLGGLFFYVGVAGLLIIGIIVRYLLKSEVRSAFGVRSDLRLSRAKQ